MREIKYRAWDNTEKEWIDYGFCLRFDAKGNCQILNAFEQPFVDKEIILVLFTGLKDRNGVEIYEGDIIRYPEMEVEDGVIAQGVVTWLDCTFLVLSLDKSRAFGLSGHWEVIGNIYSNPELLAK